MSGKLIVICRTVKPRKPDLVRIAFAEHDTNMYQKPLPYHVYYSQIKKEDKIFFSLILFLFETDREL